MADAAGVARSTLKNAAERGKLSYDVAVKLAGLFAEAPAETVAWLRQGKGRVPGSPKMASGSPVAPSELAESYQMADGAAGYVMSGENLNDRAKRLAGVVARVIASAVVQTLSNEELSKTRKGQEAIGDALSQFAKALVKLNIDASPILDVVDLLRKGGL